MFDTWITAMKDGSARSKAEAEWKNKPNWESERLYELGGLAGRKEYFSLRYQHEFDALFAGVFHPSPYLAERALLTLHYLAGGEEQERLNELTDLVCADAFEEENELRRGRKHWVKLSRLAEDVPEGKDEEAVATAKAAIAQICDYCAKVLESDDSVFSKDRVLAFVSSWKHGYLLAPLVMGLKIEHSDHLGATERNLKDQIAPALRMAGELYGVARTRKEDWSRGSLGAFDRHVLAELARNGLPLPFEAAEWHEWMDRIEPAGRWKLVYLVALVTEAGDARYGDGMAERIRSASALSTSWFERFLAFEVLANRLVDLGETEGLPALLWDLALAEPAGPQAEPGFDMHVRDRLESFILDGIRKGWIGEVPFARVAKLLESRSTFRRRMASDILLASGRAGHDISGQCDAMMACLSRSPCDQGLKTKGSDLEPYEPRKGSTDLAVYVGGEQGGFSVNGLCFLLAATETGSIPYRLALALGALAEKGHHRGEIARLLSSLAGVNAAAAAVSQSLAARKDA